MNVVLGTVLLVTISCAVATFGQDAGTALMTAWVQKMTM